MSLRLLSTPLVEGKRAVDGIDDILVRKWLNQKVKSTPFHCPFADINIRKAGNKNNRNVWSIGYLLLERQATFSPQPDVQQKTARGMSQRCCAEFSRACE